MAVPRSAQERGRRGSRVAGTPRTGAKQTVLGYVAMLPQFLRLLWGLITDARVKMLDKALVANTSDDFESSWHPAIWAGLGVQVLTVTGATLLGANTGNLASAAGLVVASSVLVPAAVTAAMNLWGTTPKATPAAVRSRDDAGELYAALRGPEPVQRASDA